VSCYIFSADIMGTIMHVGCQQRQHLTDVMVDNIHEASVTNIKAECTTLIDHIYIYIYAHTHIYIYIYICTYIYIYCIFTISSCGCSSYHHFYVRLIHITSLSVNTTKTQSLPLVNYVLCVIYVCNCD